ncbi:transposable element Tcb1 transposase [Trichonephila clavipes]|nr:transposable element Tcb1 transposase [Trichonephila clavipes]
MDFQDDNDPCHRAKVVQKWLEDHTVNRMNLPGQSPDLNPIDSLWFKIGYEISKKKPSNKRELIEALIFSFNHIVTKDLLLKLVHSMPERCRAVTKANGWPIKY